MATQKETAVSSINHIIAFNNPVAASQVLRKYGYNVGASSTDIENALMQLFRTNEKAYFTAIREIPYLENANNWTTSSESKANITNLATQLGIVSVDSRAKINFSNIWNQIVTSIGGATTNAPTTVNVTTEPVIGAGMIIFLALFGIAAIIFVFWFFGRSVKSA